MRGWGICFGWRLRPRRRRRVSLSAEGFNVHDFMVDMNRVGKRFFWFEIPPFCSDTAELSGMEGGWLCIIFGVNEILIC